jgi:DNA ligase-1
MQPNSYITRAGKRLCDPTGWWWSEKLDGVKARWIDGRLITRAGTEFNPPAWFVKLLPTFDVEGELYFGKNTFHKTASLRSSEQATWRQVKFHIFDVIDPSLMWIERYVKLRRIRKSWASQICLVKWKRVKSASHLEKVFQRIVQNGGEGVVIVNPWSFYKEGHVDNILKYKKVHDNEAVIVGYNTNEDGTRLASLIVEHGKIRFNIGTGLKIVDRYKFRTKFPVGAKVTYVYELLSKTGKPRSPVLKGNRID